MLILILILRVGFGFSKSYLFLQKGHPKSLSHPLPQFGWKKTESWGMQGRSIDDSELIARFGELMD